MKVDRETAEKIAKGNLKLGFYSCNGVISAGHRLNFVVEKYSGSIPGEFPVFLFEDKHEFSDKRIATEFCVKKNMQIETAT